MIIGITDSTLFDSQDAFKSRVLDLINSDLDYLVLRESHMDSDDLVAFLLDLLVKSDNTCKKIVVHSLVEAARHLGLTYVHLPESRLNEARKSHTRYSYSAHTLDQVKSIEVGALFALVSPVFETTCKPGQAPLEDKVMADMLEKTRVPLVALGGISPDKAGHLKALGFNHLALRSSLMTAQDPHALIALYKDMGF